MSEQPPIPPEVWKRLAEFLSAGKNGNVVFEVRDGRIVGCKLTESVRVNGEVRVA